MGAIATAVAIAERDGPRISGPNHGQSLEDGGDGQNVYNFFSRKGLVYQFRATFGDPRLWPRKIGSDVYITTHYNVLMHINSNLTRAIGFQLDFIAEGDVGTLDIHGFFLAINAPSNSARGVLLLRVTTHYRLL